MTDEILPTPESLTPSCKCCFVTVSNTDQYCPNCGFPLKESEEIQNKFIYNRGYHKMVANELTGKAQKAAITFYIIAGVFFIVGLVQFFIHATEDESSASLITYVVLSLIFLLLGVWSNKNPIAAIICGLTLYSVLLLIQFFTSTTGFFSGIIIKGLIIAGLVRALLNALEADKIRKQHNI